MSDILHHLLKHDYSKVNKMVLSLFFLQSVKWSFYSSVIVQQEAGTAEIGIVPGDLPHTHGVLKWCWGDICQSIGFVTGNISSML